MSCVFIGFFRLCSCQNSSAAAAVAASTTTITTNNDTTASEPPPTVSTSMGVSAEAVQSALENSSAQADNEVSQINQSKPKEPIAPLDLTMQANAQVCICVLIL